MLLRKEKEGKEMQEAMLLRKEKEGKEMQEA